MKNRNLPRHLRWQLPSAEANFKGCIVLKFYKVLRFS